MAVLIQREAAATRAGVVFSRDPLTESSDTIVECVFGHGEQLVSGLATPDRYRADPAGKVTASLAVKDGSGRLLRTLRDDEVAALADVAARAERGFGHPVDVEFCFEGRRLWVLQCRAITTLAGA
jgi:pyruvate,water dikinase